METTLKTSDLAARVARGAALLDRLRPGWAARIATDELAMATCDRCILGQLHGDYLDGCRALAAQLPRTFLFSSVAHGFTIPDAEQNDWGTTDEELYAKFAALGDLWRAEIRRRAEAGPTP